MRIEVKVIAGSTQNSVVEETPNLFKVKCRAPAEKGKANEAVVALLADHFKVAKSAVMILKGKSHSRKVVEIILGSKSL